MADTTVKTMPDLTNFGNVVPEGYQYYEKITTPGDDLSLPTAYFKWYNLYPPDAPISDEQDAEARAYLAAQIEQLKLDNELGFVILHRAGSYLLLMLMTWRNTNEIWESVWAKEITQPEYQPTTFPTSHRGTYCVWELGAVWHERHAWVRFIESKRDHAAKLDYIQDRFTGRL